MHTITRTTLATLALVSFAGLAQAGSVLNGGFETGDFSNWETLGTGDSVFEISSDSNTGSWAAYVRNDADASAALLKQTGIGAGSIQGGDMITVTFSAKGAAGVGGVFFAELFSVNAAGGVTQSEILGGAPIFFSDTYQTYSFDTTAALDVSGGLTVQFGAITGAEPASFSEFYIDDISVSFVPAPGALALLGLGGLVTTRRRR